MSPEIAVGIGPEQAFLVHRASEQNDWNPMTRPDLQVKPVQEQLGGSNQTVSGTFQADFKA